MRHYAGQNRSRKSTWCCECDCGNFTQVAGDELLGHKHNAKGGYGATKSCGCLRADPGIRKAARDKVAPAKRKEICEKMRKSIRQRVPPFSLSLDRAAELMGLSPDRLRLLCHDGSISAVLRSGRYYVSSGDVSDYIAEFARCEKAKCKTREKVHRRAMIAAKTQGRDWPKKAR